jgi:glycosyltransferase involved in cell wall biosynthesis
VSADGGRRLRIAQVAPVAQAVVPGAGDSIEQLVGLLCEELVRRGHEVTLFATGDSRTSARLRSLHRVGYLQDDPEPWDWGFRESMHAAFAFEQADEFDVVHTHDYHFPLPFFGLASTPLVHTHHVEVSPEVVEACARYPHAHLVAVSDYQRRRLGERPAARTIHHGIDFEAFPFQQSPGEYLLFLGRLIADKGPADAVEVAKRVGMPLVLAGADEEGLVGGLAEKPGVEYAGAVDAAERDRLLAGAGALLYPLRYPEPFGLVIVEAMACGTPVVAVELGAVAELIEPGITGWWAPSWQEMAELVPAALALDRRAVREAARARFDYRRMVDRHEKLYLELAGAAVP